MTPMQLTEGNRLQKEIATLQGRIEAFKLAVENETHSIFQLDVTAICKEKRMSSSIHKCMDEQIISLQLRERCKEELVECSMRIIRLFEKEIASAQEQFNAL